MTNFEYMKSLSLDEFALRLGGLMASTHNDEDFNKWVIFRDQCQKWAKEYLQKEHKETKR